MYSILIVEDNPSDAKIISFLLEKKNYVTHIAFEAHQAFEILQNYKIDLILLDWMLPNISGLDLLKSIKQNKQIHKTPVIIVSSKHEMKDVKKAISTGATDYIIKPIDPLILDSKLNRVLKKEIDWMPIKLLSDVADNQSTIKLPATLTRLSEVGFEIRSDASLNLGMSIEINVKFLQDLNIASAVGKIFEKEAKENYFLYKCSLMGLRESELQKIRLYLRLIQNTTQTETA